MQSKSHPRTFQGLPNCAKSWVSKNCGSAQETAAEDAETPARIAALEEKALCPFFNLDEQTLNWSDNASNFFAQCRDKHLNL
jgi:hypothetical protein